MDFKVDLTHIIPGDHVSVQNAATWLREHTNLPLDESICYHFEKCFDCRIVAGYINYHWSAPDKVVFGSGAAALAFVLRWS